MQNIQKNNKVSTNPYPKNDLETKNKKNDAIEYFSENKEQLDTEQFKYICSNCDNQSKNIVFFSQKIVCVLNNNVIDDLHKRIKESHIRICFKAEFFDSIYKNGYQNHKNLPKTEDASSQNHKNLSETENKSSYKNLIRRLKAEKDFFKNNSITPSFIEKFPLENHEFWHEVKSLFEIDENNIDNKNKIEIQMLKNEINLLELDKDILKKLSMSIFEIIGFKFTEIAAPAPLYGLLQNNISYESIIRNISNISNNNVSEAEKIYGKSALLLNDKFKNISTFSINDTFDFCPENFAIKMEKNEIELNKAGILCSLASGSNENKIKILLENYLQSHIDYFECQIHTDHIEITKENINKIFISRSECDEGKLAKIQEICISLGITMESVD